jgi:hypothetical protein
MTDIVERLRTYDNTWDRSPNDELVMQEAADEIERLRNVIADASTNLKLLYMAAGLGQKTGRETLDDALNAEINKLDAVIYQAGNP